MHTFLYLTNPNPFMLILSKVSNMVYIVGQKAKKKEWEQINYEHDKTIFHIALLDMLVAIT